MAELIRKNNEMDSTGLAEIILGYQKNVRFFVAEDTLEPIHRLIQDTLDEIRSTKKQTEKEKEDLTEYKDEQLQLKEVQEREKKKTDSQTNRENQFIKSYQWGGRRLSGGNGFEAKEAVKIRSALFALRDTAEIPFGKALEYASFVLSKTGVRPAFLLAIFQQREQFGRECRSMQQTARHKKMARYYARSDEYKVYLKNGKSCKNAKIACSFAMTRQPLLMLWPVWAEIRTMFRSLARLPVSVLGAERWVRRSLFPQHGTESRVRLPNCLARKWLILGKRKMLYGFCYLSF